MIYFVIESAGQFWRSDFHSYVVRAIVSLHVLVLTTEESGDNPRAMYKAYARSCLVEYSTVSLDKCW